VRRHFAKMMDRSLRRLRCGRMLPLLHELAVVDCIAVGEGWGAAVDYCQWETVNVSCEGAGVIILITSARYGRMRVGRCVLCQIQFHFHFQFISLIELEHQGKNSCTDRCRF